MEKICNALLCGYRKVTVNNMLIELQPLPRDTQKKREQMAHYQAKEILKLIE